MHQRSAMVFFAAALFAWPAVAQDDGSMDVGPMTIVGKIQKPEVVVEITRENLDKGFDLELRESFLRKVIEALDRAPF